LGEEMIVFKDIWRSLVKPYVVLGLWSAAVVGWSTFHIVRASYLRPRMPYHYSWLVVAVLIVLAGLVIASVKLARLRSNRSRLWLVLYVGLLCLCCFGAEVVDMFIYLFRDTNVWDLVDFS
jgi:FtsH-binding integral membrane protein